jgi:hypothetical protein
MFFLNVKSQGCIIFLIIKYMVKIYCAVCNEPNIKGKHVLPCGCRIHQKCIKNECKIHMEKKEPEFSREKMEECIICFDDINKHKDGIIFLPCAHKFGGSCINSWFSFGASICPMCRLPCFE